MKNKSKFSRKKRKLFNNPKLFFKDFCINRYASATNFLYKRLPKYKKSPTKFTIISAVYNVGIYLDEFINSVVNQRLDFEENINIILVDDGSTDNSSEIIKQWVRKYPHNIIYIYKSNGGQSSARNLGLNYVKTEWVTFIDPDDFLDINYFYLINKEIERNDNVGVLITKFKLFKEKFGTYHDGFQTDFCFSKTVRTVYANDMEDCVQFSSSSSIYKASIILSNNILFDERLTASFEDTKFFYEYLNQVPTETVIYIKNALYYYRLRASENSSSNTQWTKKAKYIQFFKNGLFEVIELYKDKSNRIPKFIQRLVLFSVIPYLQVSTINRKRIEDVLNEEEKSELLKMIRNCLSYVDNDTLNDFYTPPGNYFWIASIFNYFKDNIKLAKNRIYVNKVDLDNELVYLRLYGNESTDIRCLIDNVESTYKVKSIAHKIFDDCLINEFNICIHLPKKSKIKVEINSIECPIYSDFKLINSCDTDFYLGYEKKYNELYDIYLFIDSGEKADDNAEHLYRNWIIKHKMINKDASYYLLDKNSSHWDRLKEEGFNLLDINTLKATYLLKRSKYIFCSYLPGHLNRWAMSHTFKFQKYVFLQHGVITSNLSKPLNAFYSQINKMVISTCFEKEEILDQKYNYLFYEDDLIESGIPRLDTLFSCKKLLSNDNRKVKKVLLCPTWRSKFNTLNFQNKEHLKEFLCSDYMKNWVGLMRSENISHLINTKRIEVIFCPHVNFYSLIEENNLMEDIYNLLGLEISILNPKKVSYQDLFLDCDLLITDYSSLHFDFASLRKPIIYFQFDQEDFYGISHAYQKGLFDFRQHGFGHVTRNILDTNRILNLYLKDKNHREFKKYTKRLSHIFFSTNSESCIKIYDDVFLSKVQ